MILAKVTGNGMLCRRMEKGTGPGRRQKDGGKGEKGLECEIPALMLTFSG